MIGPEVGGDKRSVRFSVCEIREYQLIVSDNPCCKRGLPIGIGWDHSKEKVYDVDTFESLRVPVRRSTLKGLHLKAAERRRRLLKVYSEDELKLFEDAIVMDRQDKWIDVA
mmetsp:Transcript_258/g.382  ORF Transcript_258/g.382 Transcript_258/m.382 type:complete len:111 (-) Transcript_258:191-523(-)